MPAYIAFLRGVNVGQNRRIAMADVREIAASLDYANARTYLNSGNLVFDADEASPSAIAARISDAIRDRLGLDVPVVVRTAGEMRRVVAENPFPERAATHTTLHVEFLATQLPPAAINAMKALPTGEDDWRLLGTHLYLAYPNGISGAVFTPALPVVHTSRNWKTVVRLAEMADTEA